MLAVINRYKLFLIILSLILLTVLLWLFISGQEGEGDPSRGVFVLEYLYSL